MVYRMSEHGSNSYHYEFWNTGRERQQLHFAVALGEKIASMYAWLTYRQYPTASATVLWHFTATDRETLQMLACAQLEPEPHIAVLNVAMQCGLQSGFVRDFLLGDM